MMMNKSLHYCNQPKAFLLHRLTSTDLKRLSCCASSSHVSLHTTESHCIPSQLYTMTAIISEKLIFTNKVHTFSLNSYRLE